MRTLLGKELKKLRVDNDEMTIAQMAEKMGIPTFYLVNVELGRIAPTTIFMDALRKAFISSDEEMAKYEKLAQESIRDLEKNIELSVNSTRSIDKLLSKFKSLSLSDQGKFKEIINLDA